MGRGAHDDSGLVSRAIAGDAEAFSELARRERPSLEALGRRWFSDAYLAEELAQETLVQAGGSHGVVARRPLAAPEAPSRVS